jgi:hypothetical protein
VAELYEGSVTIGEEQPTNNIKLTEKRVGNVLMGRFNGRIVSSRLEEIGLENSLSACTTDKPVS